MRNITFSADESLINSARAKAAQTNTSLNIVFRNWLNEYVNESEVINFNCLMDKLEYVDTGKKFTRDELNER